MKKTLFLLLILAVSATLRSQELKPLTIDDLVKWNRITEKAISDNGAFAAFKAEPSKGDGVITLYNSQAVKMAEFGCATGLRFTADSKYLIFTIKPPEEEVTALKLKKTKKDDMPSDKLGIYNIASGITDTVDRIKSYRIPSRWAGWIAWQTEPEKEKKAAPADTTAKVSPAGNEKKEGGKKPKTQSADNGYTLYLHNYNNGNTDTIKFVTEYIFAEEAEFLLFATTGEEGVSEPGVILADLSRNEKSYLYKGKAKYKQLSMDKKGGRAAFLVSFDDKDKVGNTFSLCYWNGKGLANVAATAGNAGMPEGWIVNENARLAFGEKTERLFFGTSPAYKIKDTTILDEDRAVVDIWHYAEDVLHTQQVISRQRDMKRSYLAVFHPATGKVVQLATEKMPDVILDDNRDSPRAAGFAGKPYAVESMWLGYMQSDVYLVDVMTGSAQQIKQGTRARMRFSPAGKYLYWYNSPDSSWYTYDVAGAKEYRLTDPSTLKVYEEDNDVPDLPGSYMPAGWLKDDRAFLVSDRYDIWSLDPVGAKPAQNITQNGRETSVTYRIIDFDPDNDYIDPSVTQYLEGTNEKTREDAFYSMDMRKKGNPHYLTGGPYMLGTPVKARNSNAVIFTRESFELFPDYLLADLSFSTEKRLTDANPQQKEYSWGTAEVVKWISLDGREIEGLLYKPAGFDPSKKYPMIVNFYEKSSSELFRHRTPEPGRSTIDYHYYTSNGYLIFNPDVYYVTGYPGQSAYNCVMSGVMALIDKGFVDDKHIGAQGHSWGGYQVAYLATRTSLFAAIESGAPVVNMFSAYGGIRWESGNNRSMQYEHQQSRIGATIWDAPQRYWENSPLFAIDKIKTPILIMANDQDGAVPWYQGIEFFVAMRRMGKPAWLMNYNGEPHWAQKLPNRIDFQRRMSQFFNHYLKGEVMPAWMEEGIPATEKDFTLGY